MSNIAQWEEAEVKRSSAEASHVDLNSLRINNTQRYMNPLESTPYPLEYCCCLLGDVRGKTVLDLGCGTGENTLILSLRGATVHSLDISQELVDLAKKRLEINNASAANVHFMVGSAHEIDLPDESVDVVFWHSDLASLGSKSRVEGSFPDSEEGWTCDLPGARTRFGGDSFCPRVDTLHRS